MPQTPETTMTSNKIQNKKRKDHSYLFVLFGLVCSFVTSSKARIGLQNSCPLFLIILCFMALRLFHSRTNLKIWQKMRQWKECSQLTSHLPLKVRLLVTSENWYFYYTPEIGFWVSQFKAFFNLMQLSYRYCELSVVRSSEASFNPDSRKAHFRTPSDMSLRHIRANSHDVFVHWNQMGPGVGSSGQGKTGLGNSKPCRGDSATSESRLVPCYFSYQSKIAIHKPGTFLLEYHSSYLLVNYT